MKGGAAVSGIKSCSARATVRTARWATFAAALLVFAWGLASLDAGEVPVAELVSQLPAQDAATAARISEQLVKAGPEGIKQVAAMLVEPVKDTPREALARNAKARYAMHGLALYVSRPEAEAERKMFVGTLASLLDSNAPVEIKGFLIRQLQLAGGEESVKVLGTYLLHDQKEMCEYATQALLAIGGDKAVATLRAALPRAKGPRRLTILQALGVLRDAKSLPAELKAARDADRQVRLTGLFAAGNIGDPATAETLKKASTPETMYERATATDALLLLGKPADAERIYRHLWTTRNALEDRHVRCAALRGLVAALGGKAIDDVMAAMKDKDYQVRAVAAEIMATIPGAAITRRLVDSMKGAPPAARVDILAQLARRADRVALPAALGAMKDPEKSVRKAAIKAVAAIGKEEVIPTLIAALKTTEPDEQQVASNCLILIPGGEKSTQTIVAALRTAPKEARRALLGVLAARRATAHLAAIFACTKDEDESVRAAALDAVGGLGDAASLPQLLDLLIKAKGGRERDSARNAADAICRRTRNKNRCAEALLAALPKADVPARRALLSVLGGLGSEKGLPPLRAALKDADPGVQDAALRALAEKWPNTRVADDLLGIARSGKKPNQRVIALRGYIRVVGLRSSRPADSTVKMYEQAMSVAEQPAEKKQILSAVAQVQHFDAFKLVVPYLEDEALRAESEAAAIRLSERLRGLRDEKPREQIRQALLKITQTSKEKRRRRDAKRNMDRWYKKKKR